MARIDFNLNATLEIDDNDWYVLLDACDGDEDEAFRELENNFDGTVIDSIYGRAWSCIVEMTSFIEKPKKRRA